MGRLSRLLGDRKQQERSRDAVKDSRARWREVFGTSKEEPRPVRDERKRPVEGGSFGRSIASAPAAYKRLIQAYRSMAPGGWSDDRWEQTRHFVGIAYVAIHRCSEQLSQGEFQVFVKDDDLPDGKRPVSKRRDPDAYKLVRLLERPNDEDSFGDLLYMMNQQLDLTGMALDWMIPNRLGTPMELYVVPTATAIPQPVINPDFPDGYYRIQPVYPYGPFSSYPTPASAVGAAIPAQWVMRFKYPHPFLRYDGYSPLTALSLHLDEVEMMDKSRHSAMRRGINPSAVLNFGDMESMQPLPEPEIDRIRAEFEANQMGPDNVGNLFVATPGANLEPWGARPVDMDYQSGWDQLVSFCLGGFGITKPAAGMIEDSSYSTLFATLKQLYWLTLEPKCSRFARTLTRRLAPFFGDDLIIEIRCKPINDHDIKLAMLNFLLQCKALTKNEARKECEMPLTKEDWGDEMAGEGGEQGAQPGMPGMPGTPAPGEERPGGEEPTTLQPANADTETADEGMESAAGEERRQEEERPRPGKLGAGALGPRMKSIPSMGSFYDRVRKVLANGHALR